ncbi:MAG: DUF481 domain-containing protein [Bacteroidia bacterium]|nr:DUF481 domain-containing protein [Bacteroidia bacterium]
MKTIFYTWLFVSLFLPAKLVLGQEPSDSLNIKISLTLGGRRQAGAFSQTIVNGGLLTVLSKGNWSFDNNTTYTYSIANGFQLSNDWAVVSKLKYNHRQVSPTAIHIYKNNLLYRIQHSQRYLAGVQITPIKNKREFWFFIGGGYENTNYNGEAFENSELLGSQRSFGLATIYIENQHFFFKKRISLKYDLFFIQSLRERSDFTIWLIPSLNVSINKALSMAIRYDYRFRNVHLTELPGFNEQLTFNLGLTLGN